MNEHDTDVTELLRVADEGLEKSEAVLKRMSELAASSANAETSDELRARNQREMAYLIGELNFIGNTTQLNGQKPLDGSIQGVFVPLGWDKCVHEQA